MDLIASFIINSVTYFFIYIKNYIKTIYIAMKMSGPPAIPVLGNVLLLNDSKKLEELGTNFYQLFGSFTRCWISIIPFFWIYEPRHLKVILSGKNSQKNIFYRFLHNFIGKGLVANNGLQWKTHRKLIQPYFHINVLESYLDIFIENAKDFINNLKENEDVKITPFINNCVLNTLHRAVLGVSLENNKDSPFRKGEVLLTQRITRPWLLFETVFKYTPFAKKEENQKLSLTSYTKQILEKRKNEAKKIAPECLMDMFIEISENNCEFTDDDIIDETITFMLTGQDSVGGSLAFTLYYIAKYQEVQNKIVKELDEVFVNVTPTVTVLHNMKYLEQCIKESLRLAPSIPIISRVLTEDVTLDGVTFPAGANIFISPFVTHRLPHIFPDPLKFDPDRFSQENVDKRHPFAFIPFSMGHRNCIGYKFALLQMKIILAIVLNRFQINLVQGHEEVQFSYRATLRAIGGVWLRLTPRIHS